MKQVELTASDPDGDGDPDSAEEQLVRLTVYMAQAFGQAALRPGRLVDQVIKRLQARGTPLTEVRPLRGAVAEFERDYLVQALQLNDHKKAVTAKQLGISRKALWSKIKRHKIEAFV